MDNSLGREFFKFQDILRELEYIKYTLNGLMIWDNLKNLPEEALEYRKKVMDYFIKEYYKKISSIEFRKFYQKLENKKEKNQEEKAILRSIKKEFEYIQKIPLKEYSEYLKMLREVEEEWKREKNIGDYTKVKKQLEDIFELVRKFTKYWGNENNPYELLIKYYEKDLSVEKLDNSIEKMKLELLPLLKNILSISKGNQTKLLLENQEEEKQLKLSKKIVELLGFDFKKGRIDSGEYPTTLSNTSSDVRIITTFTEDILTGIYNTLHECGKGLYEQGIDQKLLGSFLAEIPSQLLNEAIAKIYENRIGRNKEFTNLLLKEIKDIFPEFDYLTEDEFYKIVNEVKKSPIRIEADELNYNFHIILRYELEKELLNKDITFDELFERNKEKYEKYLEIELQNERDGVLQDVHWVSGYIGFFPIYIIADIVAAQLVEKFEKEEDSLENIIKNREFLRIKRWFTEKIFKTGSLYNFQEILWNIAKEDINPDSYIRYIKSKYKSLYKIN